MSYIQRDETNNCFAWMISFLCVGPLINDNLRHWNIVNEEINTNTENGVINHIHSEGRYLT